jgi:hypothetical protein
MPGSRVGGGCGDSSGLTTFLHILAVNDRDSLPGEYRPLT